MRDRVKLLIVLLAGVPSLFLHRAYAEPPTFEHFYQGVSECRFDFSAYSDVPLDPSAEAVLIALPAAGAVRGFLINTFYFAPGSTPSSSATRP
jgi:hypothetical protein